MSRIDLEIQNEAERDIADIFQYTLQTWGEEQLEAYWSVLWEAFERIRQFPEIGRPVAAGPSGIREHALRHHTILYRSEDDRVIILRVVNPRRRR